MAAPVIDHIIPMAVFDRKAIAPVECMVWTRTTFVLSLVRATLVVRAIRLACFVGAAILLAATLCLFIATALVAISLPWAKARPPVVKVIATMTETTALLFMLGTISLGLVT